MAIEFIEVTHAKWHREDNPAPVPDGKPALINLANIKEVVPAVGVYEYPKSKSQINFQRDDNDNEDYVLVEESYESIKEALRLRGVDIISIVRFEEAKRDA